MVRMRVCPAAAIVATALALCSVLCMAIVLTKAPMQAFASEVGADVIDAQTRQAIQADADYYAALHQDGTLVFQGEAPGAIADENPEGESRIMAVYEGSLDGYGSAAKVPWLQSAKQIKAVRFADDFASLQPRSLAWWFAGCTNMRSIDLANLDASQSTTMEKMFMDCSSLAEIASLGGFDTSSSTYFGSMFRNCSSLKSLDVSHFDATHVGVLCFMFNGCSSLETLNMAGEGWRTSSLYLMVHVWENCSSLRSLDLSYLDTSGVRSMARDFKGCTSLEYLDLSGADTTNVGTLTGMFEECASLRTVKLGAGFTFNGSSAQRQCQLPDGNWKSSETGEVFASSAVPNCVAATYTKVEDAGGEGSDPSPSEGETPVEPGSPDEGLAVGEAGKAGGLTYVVLANGSEAAVALQKAPKTQAKVVMPAAVVLNGKRYAVTGIAKGAFKARATKTLIVKSQTLAKKIVKGCFKGAANLKKVKVPAACAKAYKGFFKESWSGKLVDVR